MDKYGVHDSSETCVFSWFKRSMSVQEAPTPQPPKSTPSAHLKTQGTKKRSGREKKTQENCNSSGLDKPPNIYIYIYLSYCKYELQCTNSIDALHVHTDLLCSWKEAQAVDDTVVACCSDVHCESQQSFLHLTDLLKCSLWLPQVTKSLKLLSTLAWIVCKSWRLRTGTKAPKVQLDLGSTLAPRMAHGLQHLHAAWQVEKAVSNDESRESWLCLNLQKFDQGFPGFHLFYSFWYIWDVDVTFLVK